VRGMEENIRNKSKWQLLIPIFLAIIVAGIFIYLDYKNKPKIEPGPNEGEQISEYRPQPVFPSENPSREKELDVNLGYGCAGPQHLEGKELKPADSVWEIKKDGTSTKISLGKYRIDAPERLVFDIKKLWLYFLSDKLSERRDDLIYSLEASYVSKMFLAVNGYEKEINLGGDEYMLIELDYPLGDLYPYTKTTILEYEITLELKCKNIKNNECLNNENKPLDFINGADIQTHIRFFALGCEEFDKEIISDAAFKY